MRSTITRRAALTGTAANAAAIAASAIPATAAHDPQARIEELGAELVNHLRQLAPDAYSIMCLLGCKDEHWWIGAEEHFLQREAAPGIKAGILVERMRPIVRGGCWRS